MTVPTIAVPTIPKIDSSNLTVPTIAGIYLYGKSINNEAWIRAFLYGFPYFYQQMVSWMFFSICRICSKALEESNLNLYDTNAKIDLYLGFISLLQKLSCSFGSYFFLQFSFGIFSLVTNFIAILENILTNPEELELLSVYCIIFTSEHILRFLFCAVSSDLLVNKLENVKLELVRKALRGSNRMLALKVSIVQNLEPKLEFGGVIRISRRFVKDLFGVALAYILVFYQLRKSEE